jgi:hypothetical protein
MILIMLSNFIQVLHIKWTYSTYQVRKLYQNPVDSDREYLLEYLG